VKAQILSAIAVQDDYQKMPVRLQYISTGKRLISLILCKYGLLDKMAQMVVHLR
jgi:hypothetical protein